MMSAPHRGPLFASDTGAAASAAALPDLRSVSWPAQQKGQHPGQATPARLRRCTMAARAPRPGAGASLPPATCGPPVVRFPAVPSGPQRVVVGGTAFGRLEVVPGRGKARGEDRLLALARG